MRCPKCGSLQDKVIDSRLSRDGDSIRRRRECLACETRYTTYEEIERIELRAPSSETVATSPSIGTSFLRVLSRLVKSAPSEWNELNERSRSYCTSSRDNRSAKFPTRLIGAMVMEKLHAIDPIAYVRYASVYRQFQEIGDFIEEIQTYQEKRSSRSSAQPELFQA